MKPNTLTRRAYAGKIYVKNNRKNSCRIRNRIRIQGNSVRIRINLPMSLETSYSSISESVQSHSGSRATQCPDPDIRKNS